MVFSYTYCNFFFYPPVFVCKTNTFAREKTLQLDFCFNRSNRALEIKVHQSIARTVSTAAEQLKRRACLFGGIQDCIVYLKTWLRYLEQNENPKMDS